MSDPRSFGIPNDGTQPYQGASAIAPAGQYKFTPDELRVLAECNTESFWKRSLPLSSFMGVCTYLGVQKGNLKPNPRFGAFPKVTLAVVVGYFIGKLSYQQACAEKLMALPGSYIGQVLRDRRDGKMGTTPPQQITPMFGATPSEIYSDAGPGNSLDLDTDRPLFSDDSYRPGSEVPDASSLDNAPPKPSLSYEDLRRRNRGEFADARQDPYKVDSNSVPLVTRARQPAPSPTPAPPTNKYGDQME